MITSVRGCICTRGVGGPGRIYEISMLAQFSNGLSGLLRSQAALVILGVLLVLVIVGVIFPAVWSSKKTRGTAALDVLDRILRWRR